MSGIDIGSLPSQDYSEKPRRTEGFFGETNALVRLLDPNDRVDMERFKRINDELPDEFDVSNASDEETIKEAVEKRPRNKEAEEYIFAVAGSEKASPDEVGELQGWISFYPNEEVQQLKDDGIVDSDVPEEDVLEVTYASYSGVKPGQGQMSSALRQTCARMSQISSELYPDSVRPRLNIVACVEPENEASVRVLSASGFVKKGEMITKSEGRHYLVYVLDWDRLHEIMQGKADNDPNRDTALAQGLVNTIKKDRNPPGV